MPNRFIYACISEFDEVSAEYPRKSPMREDAMKAIRNYSNRGTRTKETLKSGGNDIYVYVVGSDGFAAVAPSGAVPLRTAFGMLEYMYDKHSQGHSNLNKFVKQVMETYNNPEQDKLTQVQGAIDETKQIMLENIDKALQQQQSLEESADRADAMARNGQVFRKQARSAKNKARMSSWTMTLILIAVVLGILLAIAVLIIAAVCGSGNC